jgi:hypothetical protein
LKSISVQHCFEIGKISVSQAPTIRSRRLFTVTTRTKIGCIGVALLAVAGYFHWFPPESLSNTDAFVSAGLRVGLVMLVLWVAYPELIKLPTWISLATLVATPIIAWRPRAALVIIPILILVWILYPRAKNKSKSEAPLRKQP